jgi:ketosteroid isomerase-like protein
MDARGAAARWADTWVMAWMSHDVEAVVALYAESCVHRSAPFREPHRGRAGMREYLATAFAEESAVIEVRFSTPLIDGDQAWVEYWTVLRNTDGDPATLAGSAIARFDADGLIIQSRDYWHQTDGHIPPPISSGQVTG